MGPPAGTRPGEGNVLGFHLPPAGRTRTVFWVTCVQAAPRLAVMGPQAPPQAGRVGGASPAGDGDQVHGVVHCLEDAQDGAQGLLQVLGALAALAVFQHLLGVGSLPVWTLSPASSGERLGRPWDTGVAPKRLSRGGGKTDVPQTHPA